MGFNHLHLHCQLGSRLDALLNPEDAIKKAKESGHTSVAITDHGSLSSHWEIFEASKKHGVKPIYGCEVYVNNSLISLKEDIIKRERTKDHHLILLAKNKIGYKNLLYLNYLSNKDEEHFYYRNRLTEKEIFENSEGLICGTACMASPFADALKRSEEEAENKILEYYSVFKENFYLELQLNELVKDMEGFKEGQKTINDFMIKMSKKHDLPLVLTGDVHYLEKDGAAKQIISLTIAQGGDLVKNPVNFIEARSLYYQVEDDFQRFNIEYGYNYSEKDISTWLGNTQFIVDKIEYQIEESDRIHLPKFSDNDEGELITKAEIGIMSRFNVSSLLDIPKEYKDRLMYELEVIIRKNFSSYLLILADVVNHFKEEGHMFGGARGSAAGSLVAYSLGITEIDPIQFGLLFERFLSDSRSPDYSYKFFN